MNKKLDLHRLPVGTLIFVENGYWYGKVVTVDGDKSLEVQSDFGYITHEIDEGINYELYGTSKKLPKIGKYNVVIMAKGKGVEPLKIETKLTLSNHMTYDELKAAVRDKVSRIVDNCTKYWSDVTYSYSFDYNKCWMGETL